MFTFQILLFFCLFLAISANEEYICKKQISASLFSRKDVNQKVIRDLNRRYNWCVGSGMCKMDDIKILVSFMEDQCGFQGITTKYLANPVGMKKEMLSLLYENNHVFKR
jgi:hypothetical protein